MARDGWVLRQDGDFRPAGSGWRTEQAEVWDRAAPAGAAIVRRQTDAISFTTPGGPYVESFRLLMPSGEETPISGATWADWDHAGRLVFARDGKLSEATIKGTCFIERELIDLNGNRPARVPPSTEATRWDW